MNTPLMLMALAVAVSGLMFAAQEILDEWRASAFCPECGRPWSRLDQLCAACMIGGGR